MRKILLSALLILAIAGFGWSSAQSEAASASMDPGKIVVYSPHGEEMLTEMAEEFEQETGVRMEFLRMGGGELIDRLRAESANPQADVIYGNPSSVFAELKEEGIIEAYTPSWAAALEPYFKDTEGYWFGTIQTPVVLFYNHDMLSAAQAPKDWADLIKPQYKDMLIFRSTTSAASRATHASLMYQFDKQGTLESRGWDFFRQVDANTKRYVYNSGLMFQAIARQEGAIGFWTLSGVIDNITKNNMPFTIVDAETGAVVITDGIAVVKEGPNTEGARKFIEYAGRQDVQLKLAEKYNRMPTHPQAKAEAPQWMQDFTYRVMDVDWGRLSEKQSEWLQYYEDNVRDSEKVETQ